MNKVLQKKRKESDLDKDTHDGLTDLLTVGDIVYRRSPVNGRLTPFLIDEVNPYNLVVRMCFMNGSVASDRWIVSKSNIYFDANLICYIRTQPN